MRITSIAPKFVEFIPDTIEDGILYVSEVYGTAIHRCCCGCGEEVVTPLSPADWQLKNEGGQISLWPSVGNWNYRCQSHYWIQRNRVEWAGSLSRGQIKTIQERDRRDKQLYIEQLNVRRQLRSRWWTRLWEKIKSLFGC